MSVYNEYSKSKKKRVWFYLKILIFLIPAGLIFYMFHLDSLELKKTLAEIELEQQEFLNNFDVYVFESGYMKKQSGVQDIYVPSIALRVTNLSGEEFNKIVFYAYFRRDGRTFCRGSASLFRIKPLEMKDVYLKCVDSAVFGSVVSGLKLIEAFSTIDYTVTLNHQRRRLTVAEGIIEFNVLYP